MKTKNIFGYAILGLLTLKSRAVSIGSEVKGQSFVADFYCKAGSTNRPGIFFLGGLEGGSRTVICTHVMSRARLYL